MIARKAVDRSKDSPRKPQAPRGAPEAARSRSGSDGRNHPWGRARVNENLAILAGPIPEGQRNKTISACGYKAYQGLWACPELSEHTIEVAIRNACSNTGIPAEANGIVTSARKGLDKPE